MHWHHNTITERVASFLMSLSEINVKKKEKKESLAAKEIPSTVCAVGTDGDKVPSGFLG